MWDAVPGPVLCDAKICIIDVNRWSVPAEPQRTLPYSGVGIHRSFILMGRHDLFDLGADVLTNDDAPNLVVECLAERRSGGFPGRDSHKRRGNGVDQGRRDRSQPLYLCIPYLSRQNALHFGPRLGLDPLLQLCSSRPSRPRCQQGNCCSSRVPELCQAYKPCSLRRVTQGARSREEECCPPTCQTRGRESQA